MSKTRRSLCPFVPCEKCQAFFMQQDQKIHKLNCPPQETWSHNFVKNNVFYCNIENFTAEEHPDITYEKSHETIFLSVKVMELVKISKGEPVIITTADNNALVKKAWPVNDDNLMSAFLTIKAIELNQIKGCVTIEKLKCTTCIAKEIIVEPVEKNQREKMSLKLEHSFQRKMHEQIVAIGNLIRIPYYSSNLIYKIIDIKANDVLGRRLDKVTLSEESENKFYTVKYSTKWIITQISSEQEITKQTSPSLKSVGGYSHLIKELQQMISIGLKCDMKAFKFHVSRGIILHGPPGVGKSMLSEALLSEFNAHITRIIPSHLYNNNLNETELVLKDLFKEALKNSPSIIYIEDIENLCPKKSTSSTNHEKKILASLVTFFNDIQISEKNIVILAVTSKLDAVDSFLRKPRLFGKEFKMSVPTKEMRKEILLKLIETIPNSLNEDDIEQIASETHGFVGADLSSLCSEACYRVLGTEACFTSDNSNNILVSRDDFIHALTVVSPMEMKDFSIDIPDVRWSDIGGQSDLKLKLSQSVDWPLKYPNVFTKYGVNPPRGVLMFGPPGCSKTMIAKALAAESKLNFLNVKGPELFNKYVGESEKKVRELFQKARQVAPSIIFIDEIDALGGERSSSSESAGASVQERVLTQLLTELDGVTALVNVTLVAATNRPDRIDKALLRPGRFDRLIYVPLPNKEARMEIFEIILRKMGKMVCPNVKLDDLVALTEGYSGAEIQAICNEAGLKAMVDSGNPADENYVSKQVTMEHFKQASSIVIPRTHVDTLKIYDEFLNKPRY
ncbi:hypothetical protein TKK_0010418 [Trichogramma kaykai]|uniref:AAA+ ATPase domain-containing protein n=1 Tax=Trichogramma kaykai TaxID=54128 RepID=A0ABD2WXD6_9HYME